MEDKDLNIPRRRAVREGRLTASCIPLHANLPREKLNYNTPYIMHVTKVGNSHFAKASRVYLVVDHLQVKLVCLAVVWSTHPYSSDQLALHRIFLAALSTV
jgi:hypothetical protein